MEKFEAGQTYRHTSVATEVRLVNKEDRIYDFVASTQGEDRHGTRLFGWNLENYSKNSVILWSHNGSIPPIGRALKTWMDGNTLKIRIQFPPEGVHELADTVRRLVEEDYLRSGSVGFIPGRVVFPWERDEDVRGDDDSIHLLDNELIEFSLTPVPSNPDALGLAHSRGLISKSVADCFVVNKQVDGSSFDEARVAMVEWLESACPTADPPDANDDITAASERECAQAQLIDLLQEQHGDLLGEIEVLKDEAETAEEQITGLLEEREDARVVIRNLNKRIEDLEGTSATSDVARRVSDLEHRLKATKIISVEDEDTGIKVPDDVFAKLDQLSRS